VIRFGVLGLLIERSGYGYELAQRLTALVGPTWQLHRSAVYTALDQLEDLGLIETVTPITSSATAGPAPWRRPGVRRGSDRVVYRATEQGVVEFEKWLARSPARLEPIRSELALKVALATPARAPVLLAAVEQEQELLTSWLTDSGAAPIDSRGPQTDSLREDTGRLAAHTLIDAETALRVQCRIQWLAIVREALQQM
jgi:DNA-binding PadR family transcriptional regulator